jgi:hypothetical protein
VEIYHQKSRWKVYLAIGGIVILLISMLFTNYIAGQLAQEERQKVNLFVSAQKNMAAENRSQDDDTTMEFDVIKAFDIPVILISDTGKDTMSANFPENADIGNELQRLKNSGVQPIIGSDGYGKYAYYKQTRMLTLLEYFPWIQAILFLAFIGIGYMAFSTARKAEQDQVWVGMAKETAHQLGTPISAIIAWLEHLKLMKPDDEETMEIVGELENDVERLNLVADRFSKIGSKPKLEKLNVAAQLNDCRIYMEKRSPRKVKFNYPGATPAYMANINPPLFNWVVENLIRNSLDAMDGKGEISADISADANHIYIDLSDTGGGIPPSKLKTVFQPGFTTKKRGWGLGLSLAKRIIESYHSGKIFVKSSIVNEGTTFTIKLLKA